MGLPYTLEIHSWETPATNYPLKKVGTAEITRRRQPKGNVYRMEAVGGYMFYQVKKTIQTTNLKINGQVVMTDEPINWIGMKELAKYSQGKVLVGGLGLGLIVHTLLQNKEVNEIDVVEINPDVIALIEPLLPRSRKIHVHQGDIHTFKSVKQYDTVILDLWVGTGTREIMAEMLRAFVAFKLKYPKTNIFIWGSGASWLNPSVDATIRAKIPKDYWQT